MSGHLGFPAKMILASLGTYVGAKVLDQYIDRKIMAHHQPPPLLPAQATPSCPVPEGVVKMLVSAASEGNRDAFRFIAEQVGGRCSPDVLQNLWTVAGGAGQV